MVESPGIIANQLDRTYTTDRHQNKIFKKMATYYISGVWFTENNTITHVNLHPSSNNNLGKGTKTVESTVISLIENKHVVRTVTWNYTTAKWREGADVKVVELNGKKYLRSQKDSTVRDNLDNLIRMNEMV